MVVKGVCLSAKGQGCLSLVPVQPVSCPAAESVAICAVFVKEVCLAAEGQGCLSPALLLNWLPFVQGLLGRPDWQEAAKLPFAMLPTGSGNALAANTGASLLCYP